MTTTPALPHQLNREIVIRASRETVFRFFTDSARWAAWWGAGSTIDARPGGKVLIRYPNALEAVGEVIDLSPPGQITFAVRNIPDKAHAGAKYVFAVQGPGADQDPSAEVKAGD